MRADVLCSRDLNRATLERQLLLRRSPMTVLDTVEHLVGLQAQIPSDPYVGLWARVDGFGPDQLSRLFIDRAVVRIVVMRATLHLVTADDCLELRPLVQPVLDRELANHSEYAPWLAGVDMRPVLAFARPLLAERARTGRELRALFAERFPDLNAGALAYACRNLLAFVQVPPRGVWGRKGQVTSTTAESWLGRPLATGPSIDGIVLRYLGAFGPATVADIATWSGLTGLREVVDRLARGLRTFRDERGRELVDLPDAPRPDPDTPAPPRLLPEYDNLLLSHADRSRFISAEVRRQLATATGPARGAVLYDGGLCGIWRVERTDGTATLVIEHVPLPKRGVAAIGAEASRLLRLVAADASISDVRLIEVG